MDRHLQFRRAASERGIPEDEASTFAEFLRFAIWLSPHPTAGAPVGRYGGLPQLPVGMEWPSSRYGPLPFVVGFDCAALPRVDGLPMPADGSLLFFLHHEWAHEAFSVTGEQEFARVVYVPADVGTTTAEEPEHGEEVFDNTELSFVGPEHDLYATVAAELPGWFEDDDEDEDEDTPSEGHEHLGLHLSHLEELCALVRELWPPGRGATVSLGGHSMDTGGLRTDHMFETPETRMADDALRARRQAGEPVVPPDERARQLELEALRLMREWVPLAQFVPDDVHRGRFLIRRNDLAAGRFDKALSFTAFTE
ncbi:DUF1963 domain-containing protein [Promicromonospora sp. NPDC060271]|uniref:DUF1963 domain-containing protein n=1 Tax=Promicromonospora sp. NPDC060271 TaxID=3347089 RepID=UPI003655A804